jgi:hypothetical protein
MSWLLVLAAVSLLFGGLTLAFILGIRRAASIAVKTWRR